MQNQDNSFIVIKNVRHRYGSGTLALDDVNIDMGVGLLDLLGSNGAGKSTLMRIICTVLEPGQGQVTVGGYDVVRDRNEVRKLLGYLPQEFGAWRLQRVEEVLDTLAILSGMRERKKRRDRVREVLELVGLGDVGARKVHKLSGGMLRRLGVAQALVHDPKVLIMDEPSVGLDPEERLRFRQLMAELARERVILLSTHIVADLGSSCSDLVLIHSGRVEFRGSPLELIARADGKVIELAMEPGSTPEAELPESFEVVARLAQNGQKVLRGVSRDGDIPADARPADNITLEEAYLAFTVNQGRAVAESELVQ